MMPDIKRALQGKQPYSLRLSGLASAPIVAGPCVPVIDVTNGVIMRPVDSLASFSSVTVSFSAISGLPSDNAALSLALDAKANATHTHAIGDVTGLQATLDGKASLSHSHVIGDVTGLQAALDGKQASDAELAAIAGLTSAANKLPYFTGSGAAALADFTAAGRALVDDADAAAQRATLGLGTIATEDEATAAQIQAGTASKAVAADKLIASAAPQTLTDGATINWDMAAGYNAKVTLGGNRTLGTPTNPKAGMTYSLAVIQDGTGSRTMTWPASFDWGTTGAPTLTTTASKRDRITLFCTDAATPKFDAFLSGKGFG